MAANSRREQILARLRTNVATLSGWTVQRKRLTLEDVQNVSSVQIPMAAITAGLPDPGGHINQQQPVDTDVFLSVLRAEVVCYSIENDDPDTKISELADDVWAKLWENQRLFKWVTAYNVKPAAVVGVFHPLIAFKFEVSITYKHGKGGI